MFATFETEGAQYYDIKPENFLITNEGKPCIADAKTFAQVDEEKTIVLGKHLTYAPPEYDKMFGERISQDQASKITRYQLGVMFYNMAIGLSVKELGVAAHVGNENLVKVELISQFNFELPLFKTEIGGALQSIINQLIQDEPEARPTVTKMNEMYKKFDAALKLPAVSDSESEKKEESTVVVHTVSQSQPDIPYNDSLNKDGSRSTSEDNINLKTSAYACRLFRKAVIKTAAAQAGSSLAMSIAVGVVLKATPGALIVGAALGPFALGIACTLILCMLGTLLALGAIAAMKCASGRDQANLPTQPSTATSQLS